MDHKYGEWADCTHANTMNFFIVDKDKDPYYEYDTTTTNPGEGGQNVLKWIMEQDSRTKIEDCTLKLEYLTCTYNGSAKQPKVTVRNGSNTLKLNTHYTVEYKNNINSGTATVKIKAIESSGYIGTVTKTFTIKKAANPLKVTARSLTFTGKTQKLVTVKNQQGEVYFKVIGYESITSDSTSNAVESTEIPEKKTAEIYTVKYSTPGNENYNSAKGTVEVTIKKKAISKCNIKLFGKAGTEKYSYTYTGKEIQPTVQVTHNDAAVTKFTVSYKNNINVGTATVTITATEDNTNFTGTATKTFKIVKATNTLSVKGKNLTYTGKSQQLLTAQNAKGIVYYSTAKKLTSTNYTDGKTSIPTGITSKSYTIYYYTPGTTNYKAKSGSVTATISVNPPQSMPDEIEASEYTYIEEIIEPTCTENGYIRYICEETGDEYQEEGAMALGHDFVDGVCTRCHKEELLVDTEVYNIYEEEKWIAQIDPDTLLSTLKEWIETNANQIKAYKGEKELQEEDKIGTGSKIIFTKGEDTLEYELSVIGDIDGNGKVDFFDIVEANKHRLNLKVLENVQKLAGDIDGNGQIDFFDMIEINKYRLGL